MDISVKEYIDGVLSDEAHKRPSDNGNVEDLKLKMHLPPWFDEEKYCQGRRFFVDLSFSFFINITLGLLAVISIPSITKILVNTRRSNSTYTSYKRYISTWKHVWSWHQYDLKPGTTAWRSLETVRTRHLKASNTAKLRGHGIVSQRDMVLTQFGFIGFAILKPDNLSIRQMKPGDWEGYNHFWRTIGYMIGIEDRYNLCRKNIDETREACRILQERVFVPCLENVPEYYEHLARALLDGLNIVNNHVECSSVIFSAKYLAGVPGYVYTEEDRIAFQNKLKKHLKGKSEDLGIDAADLISKCAIDGLQKRPPRLLYVRDFDTIETTPAYKQLSFSGRYRLAFVYVMISFYNTKAGRFILNILYWWLVFSAFYIPYKAIIKFGLRNAFVNMFVEDPKDDTEPKPNAEYQKPPPPETWYQKLLTVLW